MTPGFNVGVLYDIDPETRVGAHYRSGMKHEVEGAAEIHGLHSVPLDLAGADASRTESHTDVGGRMSAFAGIFLRDNRPATPTLIQPALPFLAPFGGDSQMLTAEGPAAFAR